MHIWVKRFFARRRAPPVVPVNQEIYTSSNCHTGGFLAALRCFLPGRDIGALTFPNPNDEKEVEEFRRALRCARIWITTGRLHLCTNLPIEVIKIPDLNFRAFHPDMRQAINAKTNLLTTHADNSQIVVWAYNNGLSKTDTIKLFNRNVFGALGYLDCWSDCVADLKILLANAEFTSDEFERFFLRIKRMGQFMHTFNHPRIEALVEIARIIARRLGADPECIDSDIVVPDALTYAQWPVYPEIGNELGLRGNYHWRFYNPHKNYEINGLDSYISFAYQSYADQGLLPNEVFCPRQLPRLDVILRKQLL